MKIKKFNNLWTMGLILSAAIFLILLLIKCIFPEFVIGVAETSSIVKFGNYVDSHKFANILFTFATSFLGGYFYCCACCRKKKLSLIDIGILLAEIAICFLFQFVFSNLFAYINIALMAIMPAIICAIHKTNGIKYLYSTITTLSTHIIYQAFSLKIRDIDIKINYPNSATYFILLIDAFVWLILLYNYFNYKEAKLNGQT